MNTTTEHSLSSVTPLLVSESAPMAPAGESSSLEHMEPTGKPPLEQESTEDVATLDLMALSEIPSMGPTGKSPLEQESTEDLVTLDLMPPFEIPSLEDKHTSENKVNKTITPSGGDKSYEKRNEALNLIRSEDALKEHVTYLKNQILKNLSPYEILGINKEASQEEIKKRCRELLRITHPDKGGDEDVFNAILQAFKNLSTANPEQEEEEHKEDGEVGFNLITAGCTPYVNTNAFFNLSPIEQKAWVIDQTKLAVLLGKQKRIYCKALMAKYKGIDLDAIDTDSINYNSVDLDSTYLSQKNREKIIALSQKAILSRHSLFGLQAITTEIVAWGSPALYLAGWKLIHDEPGIESDILKLFKSWSREERKKLATAIGNQKINYPQRSLISILEQHDSSNNPNLDASFDCWVNANTTSTRQSLAREGKPSNKADGEEEICYHLHSLPHPTIRRFVEELKEKRNPKDDNYWYEVGVKSIKASQSDLTESAFSFLSPGAQRYVAIELGRISEGRSPGNKSLRNLICWANIQEQAKDSTVKEKDLMCSNDSPEPSYQTKSDEEENIIDIDEEGLWNTPSGKRSKFSFFKNALTYEPPASPESKRRKISPS